MQPGLGPLHGIPFRPEGPSTAPADDFLGLEAELARGVPLTARGPASPYVHGLSAGQPLPTVHPGMPAAEMLPPGQHLAASWPEVRANTWRVGRDVAPHPPAGDSERPSWLLELDDARIPPAHPSFVPTTAPANASFRDGTEIAHRVAPWFVRALCVFAGLFLCAVITRTVLLRRARPPVVSEAPVVPLAQRVPDSDHDLLAPGDDAQVRAGPAGRPGRPPAQAGLGLSAAALVPGAFSAPDPRPESPALVVYDLPAPQSPTPGPAGGADLDREQRDRWLAEQSRASSPLSDVGAIVAGPAGGTGTASPTAASASGIWEGATIPVEALQGGLRLQTPSVGRVRVRLEGGTRTEGRLTGIGQGRVWIETDAGPVEIDSSKMRGLEQIPDRPVASAPRTPERQRVRTAGGVFFGRVLARDGRTVTLITDAGTRVTVEADEIADADPGEGN